MTGQNWKPAPASIPLCGKSLLGSGKKKCSGRYRLIDALLQAEPDILDLNRAAEARLDAERADAAAIEALLQAEPDVLDLNRAVLSSVQSARTLRLNE